MNNSKFYKPISLRRPLTVLLMILFLVSGLFSIQAPASAQVEEPVPSPAPSVNVAVVNDGAGVEAVSNIYLPIIVANGQSSPPPDSPYSTALSQALADCADMMLNQVCYARGSVTLDGGEPLTTPGQVATLDGVSGLTLVSPDADHWSIALLRLAADSYTPDLGLTLLAFGNVEIRNLTLFDATAGNGDVAPALLFSSSPVPGEDPVTGALIVYNPTHEEPLSIGLNGADLTLASSAAVQAQPGDKMTVTMATGSAIVQTAGGEGVVMQAHQLTVPLNSDGKAAMAPTDPALIANNYFAAIAARKDGKLDDFFVPEFVTTRDSIAANIFSFADAEERCMQGDSRQVYRMMYYGRILQGYNLLYPNILYDDRMARFNEGLKQCATFEIEFNSVINRTGKMAPGDMYIQGQGMIVRYNIDGTLVQSAQMPLKHQHYNVVFPWTGCYSLTIEDGRLILHDGYMRINRNRLDISTKLIPVDVWEHLYFTCGEDTVEWANPAAWSTMFRKLHESEQILVGFHFTPDHWKYTGNQILAEAIFSGRKIIEVGIAEFTGDTWLVMLHKPGS